MGRYLDAIYWVCWGGETSGACGGEVAFGVARGGKGTGWQEDLVSHNS